MIIKKIVAPYLKSLFLFCIYFLLIYSAEKILIYFLNYEWSIEFISTYLYFFDTVVYSFFLALTCLYMIKKKNNCFIKWSLDFKLLISIFFSIILLSIIENFLINIDYIFLDKDFPLNVYLYSRIEIIADFLNIVILASIFEELLFRKITIDFFFERGIIIEGIIVSSLMFSLIHFINLEFSSTRFISYFLFGLFYSYLYIKTKKVIYPIIAHAITNFIWLFLKVFQEQYLNILGLLNFNLIYIFVILLSVILFFLLARYTERKIL